MDSFRMPQADTLCFVFVAGAMLVRRVGERVELPSEALLRENEALVLRRHEVGVLGALRCLAVELEEPPGTWQGFEPVGLRGLHGRVPSSHYRMAGRAAQILEWDRAHRFCGACGTPTQADPQELARRCPACGRLHFPRLSPAVIVRIARGRDLLLARSPHFPEGMYSTLAGFVEPGETLEEAVVREVREEVGVEVAGLRYFGSQPWPFPHSLMIGFTADYAGGELRPDRREIEDAGWFAVNALPLVPARLSIARELIDDFVRRHGLDPAQLRSPA